MKAGDKGIQRIRQEILRRLWKPLPVIGPGVNEIRIHVLGEWRVIYIAKLRDAVYVLHAFQKKTRKTSQHDIDFARQRYRQIGGNL